MKTNLDSVFWSVKIFQNNFQNKLVTFVTLCHNLKSQKSNFYNWISITWQNSIGCKPIRSQYFDWVAYWCSKGQKNISDFLFLFTGSHDSPIWLIRMTHISQYYLSDEQRISPVKRGFKLTLIRSWYQPIRERELRVNLVADHQKNILECFDDDSYWWTNQIGQNNIFY